MIDDNDNFNKIENIGLILGIISFAIFFGIQTALENFRAHFIKKYERHLDHYHSLRSDAPAPTSNVGALPMKLSDDEVDLRATRVAERLQRARLGFQLNGIMGVYGAIPTALVITSASDGPYSAIAIYFGAVLGAHAFWGIVSKPRKISPSMLWCYHILIAAILMYLSFGPGLSVLKVDEFIKEKIHSADDSGFRVMLDFRKWPAPSVVRKVWIWLTLIEWTRWQPVRWDHLRWWSPLWGFIVKMGITSILFYAWHERGPPDLHIDGLLFQYATEEWSGRHLIFLMYSAGLTFITVEKRRRGREDLLLTREERGEPVDESSEVTYIDRLRRAVSHNGHDDEQSSHDIEVPTIGAPPPLASQAADSPWSGSAHATYSVPNGNPNSPPRAHAA